MSVNFFDLMELAQLRALNVALEPSMDSIWRMRCRSYSQQFHTPLHIVENELEPLKVLEALYESQLTPSEIEDDLEGTFDKLMTMKDPTYSRMSQADTEMLVDSVMNKELARLKKKKPPTQQSIEQAIKETPIKATPKSGGMSFDSLERMETVSESNKAGFNEG